MKYRLDELSVIKRGGSPRPITDYLANEGLPWLKISDFNYGERYVYNSHEQILQHPEFQSFSEKICAYMTDFYILNQYLTKFYLCTYIIFC